MIKKVRSVLALGVVVSTLAACGGGGAAIPDDQFFRLNTTAAPASSAVLDGTVEVERFSASGVFSKRPVLYSEPGSNAVSEYIYHFWTDSPPVLLQAAMVSHLRASGVADRVVTPDLRVRADYTVLGRVIRMETVRGASPTGVVTLELALRREKDGELLVLGEYSAEIAADGRDIHAAVQAIDAAVNDAFKAFVQDMKNK
ncbi:ABC-type transport auxiliary lipoprotein family protein [Pseudomonadota bacterium]